MDRSLRIVDPLNASLTYSMSQEKFSPVMGGFFRRAASCAVLLLCACPRSAPVEPSVRGRPTVEVGPFDHAAHLAPAVGLECAACHAAVPDQAYALVRPGSDDHAPCVACHEDAFRTEPAAFCKSCHDSVNPLKKGDSPLGKYPSVNLRASLVSAFNHQRHLDDATRDEGGAGLECQQCHRPYAESDAFMTFPTHADCARCHAAAVAPRMENCGECHHSDGPGRARRFTRGDIRFTHAKHQTDVRGGAVACARCHEAIPRSSSSDDLNLPRMATCNTCHDSAEQTPERVRITRCGTCHLDDVEAQPLPGSHTP